nr:MAG TPA: hypothetical protein [Caudoviricetes sp.]
MSRYFRESTGVLLAKYCGISSESTGVLLTKYCSTS